ncbi:MAG: hypothetical protein Q9227_004476 [Pyrenula ochraceoflavens]
MATVVVQQQQPIRHSATPPPLPPSISLHPRSTTPVPNKHIPYCPSGPSRSPPQAPTPPQSPDSTSPPKSSSSLLYPPDSFPRLSSWPSPVFSINAKTLSAALDHASRQPLPDPQLVFPWLHGLHVDNHVQQAFFVAKKKTLRRTPKGLRAITVVKVGGDLTHSKIKGAITLDEILSPDTSCAERNFVECDPPEGFSVRNFHIQAAKIARVSDIVLYGDRATDRKILRGLAESISSMQRKLKKSLDSDGHNINQYNTFVLSTPFSEVEKTCPELVVIDSRGNLMDLATDFVQWERNEMAEMSKASEISESVWQGPTPDWTSLTAEKESAYDIYIETCDQAPIPDDDYLDTRTEQLGCTPIHVEFPSSGSIIPTTWSSAEVDGLLSMCRWIYNRTHPTQEENFQDADGDIQMTTFSNSQTPYKVLIHCADGYTESTLLAIAYFVYAEGVPVHDAWLRLHCEKKRNFFAYPADVSLLAKIENRLLAESPKARASKFNISNIETPAWFSKLDGSFPSRILPYMYLGNLTHANNPDLLRSIGIKRILSIGEPVSWSKQEHDEWGRQNIMMINRVQDNGIDPLTQEFDRCLEFIGPCSFPCGLLTILADSWLLGRGKIDQNATLVHCRVGVSRSATICIAEVMASLGLSFPRAYCFVRARRLNVIIQPHLRFVYELMKWEEELGTGRSPSNAEQDEDESRENKNTPQWAKREMEWAGVAREIAGMNRPYARQ